MVRVFLIIISATLLLSPSISAEHFDDPVPNVLLLHSYHHGFAWSDRVTVGVREQLRARYQNVHLDVQYLDEKRVPGARLWPNFLEILRSKYEHRNPDVIIAIDDSALRFLLEYRDTMFPETPVVFGGLSHFEEAWRLQRPLLTGVVEQTAIAETVSMALDIHPEVNKVIVVNDSTTTGLQRHVQAILALEPLFEVVETEHWIDLTVEELKEALSRLDAQSLVMFVSFYRDASGEVFSGKELARLASEVSQGPVYTTQGPLIGHGVVGGLVNQGDVHGRLVAQLAVRILAGVSPEVIPVMSGPSTAMFDYEQLQRLEIDERTLPAESRVVKRPPSLVTKHPLLVELGVFLFLLLLIVHLASVFIHRMRKKTADELKKNLNLLQAIIESIPDPIFYKDAGGRYLGANKAFCTALGHRRDEIIGKTVYEVAPTDLAQIYHRADLDLIAKGGSQAYETQVRFADGQRHDMLFHKAVFPGEDGQPAGMVGAMLDITERKQIEEALRDSEERFRTLFETSPDPIVLSEIEGTIIDVNRGFEEQSGVSREEALGKSSLELGLWNDPDDRERLLSALRSTGEVNNLDVALQTHRGERSGLVSARLIEYGGKTRMLFVVRDITDLHRAEKALEQSELRLRTVFEASPDAILVSRSGGGGIVDVNAGFTRLWGYEREEVLWRSTVDLNLWVNLAEREQLRRVLHREGRIDNFEIGILRKDGSRRVCSASCRLIELDGGPCTLAVFRDITHHKAAEDALSESEQRLNAVFHQTFQFMAILDPSGQVLDVNDAALTALDLKLEGVQGATYWETPWWQEGEQRDMVRLAVETAARGNLFQVRTYNLLPDGTRLHLDFSLKPVRDAWGEIIYLIPEGRDISGLMVAEQALRESETRYRGLSGQFQMALDGVPDVMMIFDPQGMLIWNNQSAAKAFDLIPADIGQSDCRRVWGEKEKCRICREKTFVGGEPWEDLIETADGITWGIKTFPVKDSSGAVLHIFQIATDLSEKIRLREQASRSAHLAALGEVAAGVAHEINNPTGLMLMDLGLLQDVYRDLLPIIEQHRSEHGEFECGGLTAERVLQEIPPIFDELRDGAARIKQIVEELKDFANPHAELMQDEVDLNEVVNRALRLTRKNINAGGNRIQVELDQALPYLSGNSQRLEQVVINLLLNAAQAMKESGGSILVTTMHDVKRRRAILSVIDDGCGIPDAKLVQITDPFFTTRREEGGTGLGLSVSARIIEEHHGTMNFTSREGEGTCVTLEFPLPTPER